MKTVSRNTYTRMVAAGVAVLAGMCTAWAAPDAKPADPFVKGNQPSVVQAKVAQAKSDTVPLEESSEQKMETRSYSVNPNVIERATAVARDISASRNTDGPGEKANAAVTIGPAQDLKKLFGDLGVFWPVGSSISYLTTIGKLRVVNTVDNLVIFEKVLVEMNVTPRQIEIEVQFVAFDQTNVEKLIAAGRLNLAALTNLWINGSGHLLAAPRVTTKAGQEAVAKEVTEVLYPTAFRVCTDAGVNTNTATPSYNINTNAAAKGAASSTSVHGHTSGIPVVEPGAFQTREVGAVLQVVPEVSTEGQMINLTLNPQLVGEPVWRDYGSIYVDSNGKEQQVRMEQPFFAVSSVSTSVSIYNGQRILIGGGMPMRDHQQVVYTFVTARLLSPSGDPVK